jgi:hypothetical protein
MVQCLHVMNRRPEHHQAVQAETRKMFDTLKQSSPFDGMVIDDRNERPMTIALATILVVWSMAFALTFATGHAGAHSAFGLCAAAITSSMSK